jgi:hypothetical protein
VTRELAHRGGDGVDVRLVWDDEVERIVVFVEDWRTGEQFEIEARRDNALDVFHHPFAYRS